MCTKRIALNIVIKKFRYLVGASVTGLWSRKNSHFDLVARDADYNGDKIKRKSTSTTCQFLRET